MVVPIIGDSFRFVIRFDTFLLLTLLGEVHELVVHLIQRLGKIFTFEHVDFGKHFLTDRFHVFKLVVVLLFHGQNLLDQLPIVDLQKTLPNQLIEGIIGQDKAN